MQNYFLILCVLSRTTDGSSDFIEIHYCKKINI